MLKAVVTHPIQGTQITRSQLDLAVARCFRNARRISRRLEKHLLEHPDEPLDGVHQWMADYEQRFVFLALREQRERAKLTAETGAALVDDATFEQQLKELAHKAIQEMPKDELEQLVKTRTAVMVEVKNPWPK